MRYGKIYIDLSLVLMIGMRLLPGHPYGKRQSTSLNPLRQVLTDRTRVCASSMIRSLYDMSIYEVLLLHLNSGRIPFWSPNQLRADPHAVWVAVLHALRNPIIEA